MVQGTDGECPGLPPVLGHYPYPTQVQEVLPMLSVVQSLINTCLVNTLSLTGYTWVLVQRMESIYQKETQL